MDLDGMYKHDGYIGMMDSFREGQYNANTFGSKPLFEVPLLTKFIELFYNKINYNPRLYAAITVGLVDAILLSSLFLRCRESGGVRKFFIQRVMPFYHVSRTQKLNCFIGYSSLLVANYMIFDINAYRLEKKQEILKKELAELISEK